MLYIGIWIGNKWHVHVLLTNRVFVGKGGVFSAKICHPWSSSTSADILWEGAAVAAV